MDALPRVSDVLRLIYPNSLDFIMEHHLEEGSRLHGIMEQLVNDQIYFGELNDELLEARIGPIWDWFEKEDVVFHSTEEQISHKYGFTGRPDLLAAWKGVNYCFDYKFSEGVTEQNRVQACAYHHLTGRKFAFIQCDRKGKVTVKKYKPEPSLWAIFISALNLKKFQLKRGIV